MAEFHFKPLPPDYVAQISDLVSDLLGDPDEMEMSASDECMSGVAKIWQEGDEEQICVTVYAKNADGLACAHADGIDPTSPLGELCQRIIDQGYGLT